VSDGDSAFIKERYKFRLYRVAMRQRASPRYESNARARANYAPAERRRREEAEN